MRIVTARTPPARATRPRLERRKPACAGLPGTGIRVTIRAIAWADTGWARHASPLRVRGDAGLRAVGRSPRREPHSNEASRAPKHRPDGCSLARLSVVPAAAFGAPPG